MKKVFVQALVASFFTISMSIFPLATFADPISELQTDYQAKGAAEFSPVRGEKLWKKDFVDAKSDTVRNCSTCHTANLTTSGKHARTKKVIKPMAPSVNPTRYRKKKKIEKWFLRNCKWTFGRECTAQEKGDFLSYLKSL